MNRNSTLYGLFLLLVLALPVSLFSQKVLSLENPGRFKRIFFQPGDVIRFGTEDSQGKFSGVIESVSDSVIVIVKVVQIENEGDATNNVFRDYVPLREITVVYNTRGNWWSTFRNMYAGAALVGGGALIGIGVVNSIIENQAPDPGSMILAGSISASGLLMRSLGRNKYRIGKSWQLRAMDPMVVAP